MGRRRTGNIKDAVGGVAVDDEDIIAAADISDFQL